MFKKFVINIVNVVFLITSLMPIHLYAADNANPSSVEARRSAFKKLQDKVLWAVKNPGAAGRGYVDINHRFQEHGRLVINGLKNNNKIKAQMHSPQYQAKLQDEARIKAGLGKTPNHVKILRYLGRVGKITMIDSVLFFFAGLVLHQSKHHNVPWTKDAIKFTSESVNDKPLSENYFKVDPQNLETEFTNSTTGEGLKHFYLFILGNQLFSDGVTHLRERGKITGKVADFTKTRWMGYVSMAFASVFATVSSNGLGAIWSCNADDWVEAYEYFEKNKTTGEFNVEESKKKAYIEKCEEYFRNWQNKKMTNRIAIDLVGLIPAAMLGGFMDFLVTSPVTSAAWIKDKGSKVATSAVAKARDNRLTRSNFAKKVAGSNVAKSLTPAQVKVLAEGGHTGARIAVELTERLKNSANKLKLPLNMTTTTVNSLATVYEGLFTWLKGAELKLPKAQKAIQVGHYLGKGFNFIFFLAAMALFEPITQKLYLELDEYYYRRTEDELLNYMNRAHSMNYVDDSFYPPKKRPDMCRKMAQGCITESTAVKVSELMFHGRDFRQTKLTKTNEAYANWLDYVYDMLTEYEDAKSFYEQFIYETNTYTPKSGTIDPFKAVLPIRLEGGDVAALPIIDEERNHSTYLDGTTQTQKRDTEIANYDEEVHNDVQYMVEQAYTILAPDIQATPGDGYNFLFINEPEELQSLLQMSREEMDRHAKNLNGEMLSDETREVLIQNSDAIMEKSEEVAKQYYEEWIPEFQKQEYHKYLKDSVATLNERTTEDNAAELKIIGGQKFVIDHDRDDLHRKLRDRKRFDNDAGKRIKANFERDRTKDISELDPFTRGRILSIKRAAKFLNEKLAVWKKAPSYGGSIGYAHVNLKQEERATVETITRLLNSNKMSDWKAGISVLSNSVNIANKCDGSKLTSEGFDPETQTQEEYLRDMFLKEDGPALFCVKDFAYQMMGNPYVKPYGQLFVDDLVSTINSEKGEVRRFNDQKNDSSYMGFRVKNNAERYLVSMLCGPQVKPGQNNMMSSDEIEDVKSAVDRIDDLSTIETIGNAFMDFSLTSLRFKPPQIVSVNGANKICKKSNWNPAKRLAVNNIYADDYKIIDKFGVEKRYTSLVDLVRDNLMDGPLACLDQKFKNHPSCVPSSKDPSLNTLEFVNTPVSSDPRVRTSLVPAFTEWWVNATGDKVNKILEIAKDFYKDNMVKDIIEPAYYGDRKFADYSFRRIDQYTTRFDDNLGIAGQIEAEMSMYTNVVVSPIIEHVMKQDKSIEDLGKEKAKLKHWSNKLREAIHELATHTTSRAISHPDKDVETQDMFALNALSLIESLREAADLEDGAFALERKQYESRLNEILSDPTHPEAHYKEEIMKRLEVLNAAPSVELIEVELTESQKLVISKVVEAIESLVKEIEGYRGFFTYLD